MNNNYVFRLIALGLIGPFLSAVAAAGAPDYPCSDPGRAWRVLAAGDSITEGGAGFANWRSHLNQRLKAAGYAVEFVGTRETPPSTGALRHEGYGGKNVEFLAKRLAEHFPNLAADIVLLHAGHNHFADEAPVPGMLAATEAIIATCRATNPRVVVLLAQVIPSAKLPKYSYIPEFNRALVVLAARLTTADSPVVIVDQNTGYDPVADNVADLVHPNAHGAAKIAARWFEALTKVLPPPKPAGPVR